MSEEAIWSSLPVAAIASVDSRSVRPPLLSNTARALSPATKRPVRPRFSVCAAFSAAPERPLVLTRPMMPVNSAISVGRP